MIACSFTVPPPLINKMWIRVFFTPPSSLLSIGNINMSMLAAQKYDQKITNVILLHVYLLACLAALLWLIFKCWHSMDYPKQHTHHLCITSIIGYRSYTGRRKTKILLNQKSHAVFDNFKKNVLGHVVSKMLWHTVITFLLFHSYET